jgi:hypothetical protein
VCRTSGTALRCLSPHPPPPTPCNLQAAQQQLREGLLLLEPKQVADMLSAVAKLAPDTYDRALFNAAADVLADSMPGLSPAHMCKVGAACCRTRASCVDAWQQSWVVAQQAQSCFGATP